MVLASGARKTGKVKMKEKLKERAEQGETENRKSVWKKLLIGFFITLCVLVVLPFAAVIGPIYAVAYAVCTPFERKKYRKSFYWRELKVKYYWGITSGFDYLFYNAAREENLPLKRKTFSSGSAYYLWTRETEIVALVIVPLDTRIRNAAGAWLTERRRRSAENALPLREALEACEEGVKSLAYPLKIVLEKEILKKKDLEAALREPAFLVIEKKVPLKQILDNAWAGGLEIGCENEGKRENRRKRRECEEVRFAFKRALKLFLSHRGAVGARERKNKRQASFLKIQPSLTPRRSLSIARRPRDGRPFFSDGQKKGIKSLHLCNKKEPTFQKAGSRHSGDYFLIAN